MAEESSKMSDASTPAKPPKKEDIYPLDYFYVWSPKKRTASKSVGFSRKNGVGKQILIIENTNHAAAQPVPAQLPPVHPAAAQSAPVQLPAAQPAPVRVVVQDAGKVASDGAINTTNASNTANKAEERGARNRQPATIPTTPTASPDTKHKRVAARSNSKAKRQQSEEVDTPKAAIKPTKKKKLGWAMNIENYLGTGNQRSDARIKVWEGPGYAADASDSENSSNDSMTDPTPPIAMSSNRRSRYIGLRPEFVFGSSDTASDAASSAASGTDIVAGQTYPFFYHSSERYFCNDTAPNTQREQDFAQLQGKSQEQKSTRGGGHGIRKNSKNLLPPIFIQTNRKVDIASGLNNPRDASTSPEPELSYTSEGLRRLKRSNYDPVTVQAVGRGGFGIPLPKKRQTHTSSENSPLEGTYRRSRSDPGTTASDADHQYKKVKDAISDAKSNAELNKGLSSGRSGNASTSGERRCSLELAREKGRIRHSSESQGSEPQYSSRYPKPIFVFRPDDNDDGRQPLIVFRDQRDLDELKAQHRRSRKHQSRKQRDASPPYPSDVVVKVTKDESRIRGASKTSRPSYQRPYVSEENGGD